MKMKKIYSTEDIYWLSFIAECKWPTDQPYCCLECSYSKFSKGKTPYSRKCSNAKCKYEESVLAGTIFHGFKLPVSVCVDILYAMMCKVNEYFDTILQNKRWVEKFLTGNLPFIPGYSRISSVQIAKNQNIQQKTAWYFIERLVDRFQEPAYSAEQVKLEISDYKNWQSWFKWIKPEKQSGYYTLMCLLLRSNFHELDHNRELRTLVSDLVRKTHCYESI